MLVGVLSVCFLSELMATRFGRGFYEGGSMDPMHVSCSQHRFNSLGENFKIRIDSAMPSVGGGGAKGEILACVQGTAVARQELCRVAVRAGVVARSSQGQCGACMWKRCA
jgi:hypothetical protein